MTTAAHGVSAQLKRLCQKKPGYFGQVGGGGDSKEARSRQADLYLKVRRQGLALWSPAPGTQARLMVAAQCLEIIK